MSPGVLAGYGVIDDLTDPGSILEHAVSTVRDLAAQPAFKIVKRQARGALGTELRLFAADEVDPFLTSFE